VIRQTSLDAYNELKANGKANTQRGIILHCLILRSAHRIVLPLSRTELSDLLNIRINAICGRVKELLDDELVEEVPNHKCSVTKNNVNGIKAILFVQSGQKDLF